MSDRCRVACLAILCAFSIVAAPAVAQVFYYPAKGQSSEQTDKDKFECYGWAKGQTGFDPATPPPAAEASAATNAAQTNRRGSAVRGAAGGAAAGAVGGAIAGDAGKGAAIGAGVGAVAGRARANRKTREAQTQDQATQDAQMKAYNDQRASWQRAVNACMEGRGYTVQ